MKIKTMSLKTREERITRIKNNLDNFLLTKNEELLKPYGDDIWEALKEILLERANLSFVLAELIYNGELEKIRNN